MLSILYARLQSSHYYEVLVVGLLVLVLVLILILVLVLFLVLMRKLGLRELKYFFLRVTESESSWTGTKLRSEGCYPLQNMGPRIFVSLEREIIGRNEESISEEVQLEGPCRILALKDQKS